MSRTWHAAFLLSVFFPLLLLSSTLTASASLLAIDYGSEWIKASLIKPGVPFDVLLNRDSKRKIQSSVSWKGDERLFGSDAFNLATRYPSDSFTYLKLLEGAPFESAATEIFRSISPAKLTPTSRGTVGFVRSDAEATEWSVEELIAMQFSYIKELAETVGGPDARELVRDTVVVVPPYFTQFERDAVADALEIAGLRLTALINDGTAVAMNFAMTRSFEKKTWHIIYDAGAGGVRASAVSFETTSEKGKKGKESTQISVAGVGFDRSAGGLELDRRLRDMLAMDFEVKHGMDITKDARGMARLWKEAGRVKAILSANTEASANIESIAFDVDYRSKVTRASFEAACADLKPKFAQPILDAIANAGLTLDDITSVILTGGHSRTPMVKASVTELVGDDKIAVSVNADESAVLGGALYGASVSPQFRTKDIKVQDIVPYDIQVSYLSQPKIVEGEDTQVVMTPRTIHAMVFPAGSKTGGKKTMTFKRKDDFNITMSYKDSVGVGIPMNLLEAEIAGVKEAFAELEEAGAVEPVIKATLLVSESGFAGIQDAIAFGEIKKDETLAGKIKDFFGAKEGNETPFESSASGSSSSSPNPESMSTSTSTSSSTPSSSAHAKKLPRDTIPLTLNIKPLSIPALTPQEIKHSRERLIAINMAEAGRRQLEDAQNSLEAYIYRLRDLLERDDDSSPFFKCSRVEEREVLQSKVQEAMTWMNEDSYDAKLSDFLEKKRALENLEKPIHFRYAEIEAFPSTLNESQRVNWMTRLFITEARKNLTAETIPGNLPALHTNEELLLLEEKLREHETWLARGVQLQKGVLSHEDPAIHTEEMKKRAKALEKELLKLMRRKTPAKRKGNGSSSSESSTSTTEGSRETPDGGSGGPGPDEDRKHDEL